MNINKLHNLIDGKSITKAFIIKETGISRPALDSILEGNDFKVSNLEKIAHALNRPVGFFFDENFTSISTEGDYSPAAQGNVSMNIGDTLLIERVKHLEELISEKNERISELKERIEELKSLKKE